MKEKKIEVVVLEDGRIVIEDLPVRKGQHVEVIVRIEEPVEPGWPLRGLPVKLIDPFLPGGNPIIDSCRPDHRRDIARPRHSPRDL